MSSFTSTIIITGGTTGLGYWAAYDIARQSPSSKVIICSRADRQNAAKSLNDRLSKHRSSANDRAQIEFQPLDLASFANIRAFVNDLLGKNYPPISSLVLNAGIQFHEGKDIRYSADGIELTFATNHVGHALLFFLLKPHLTDDARIVITASGIHDPGPMAKARIGKVVAAYETAELLAHPTDTDGYGKNGKGIQRYASSKLANVMFTLALERHLQALRRRPNNPKTWTVVAMDPGLMPGTSLARNAGALPNWIWIHLAPHVIWLLKWIMRSDNVHLPTVSGTNLARHALAPRDVALVETGRYFEGATVAQSSQASRDVRLQDDLWTWTVQVLGRDEAERREFESF